MTQNNSFRLRLGAAFLVAVALSGCAGMEDSAPVVDGQLGRATRALWRAQTINPNASRNTDPVNGMDGVSAVGNIQGTQQTFIGLGNSTGGSMSTSTGSSSGSSGGSSSSSSSSK